MENEEVTYGEAKKAKETLLKYLESKYTGYDGDDVWGKHSTEYLVLIALNRIHF